MEIALKEARETEYWLEILIESEVVEKAKFSSLLQEADEIVKILVASTRKIKERLNGNNNKFRSRKTVELLLNLIEQLNTKIKDLVEENQKLRDENNRLKGEQGKLDIKANKNKASKLI